MNTISPAELLDHYDRGTYWPQGSGLDMASAYEHALTVRQLRIARGEQPRGFKIGFTNRGIWARYNVFAPVWGTVWDTTLSFCDGRGEVSLDGMCQPRLEPEAVFGITRTPPARAGLDDLFACIDWVAPGFEVVQTHMPGWKFEAADTVADGGLHGRLLVGARVPVRTIAADAAGLEDQLARAKVFLHRGKQEVDSGAGAVVLDGPLHALQYFLQALRDCPGAPDLMPGDVVTTGTWTDAWPVAAGETWAGQFDAPLGKLEVVFS
jgi:2-keto-4-pentenoate hydratase